MSELGFLKVKKGGGGGGGGGGVDCFGLRLNTRYDRGDGLSCAKDSGVSEPVIRVWSHFADSDKRMTSKRYDLQCRSLNISGFVLRFSRVSIQVLCSCEEEGVRSGV